MNVPFFLFFFAFFSQPVFVVLFYFFFLFIFHFATLFSLSPKVLCILCIFSSSKKKLLNRKKNFLFSVFIPRPRCVSFVGQFVHISLTFNVSEFYISDIFLSLSLFQHLLFLSYSPLPFPFFLHKTLQLFNWMSCVFSVDLGALLFEKSCFKFDAPFRQWPPSQPNRKNNNNNIIPSIFFMLNFFWLFSYFIFSFFCVYFARFHVCLHFSLSLPLSISHHRLAQINTFLT